jgi:hypothetical protein
MLAFIPFFLSKSGIKNQNHNLQEENSSLFSYSLSFLGEGWGEGLLGW